MSRLLYQLSYGPVYYFKSLYDEPLGLSRAFWYDTLPCLCTACGLERQGDPWYCTDATVHVEPVPASGVIDKAPQELATTGMP